jgi:KDO2-lipid IV(A) lauroyltransferase
MGVEKHSRSSPMLGAVARCGLAAGAGLPIRLMQALGAGLGRGMARGHGRMREVSELNLAMCLPELTATERSTLVGRSLVETGRTAFEMGAIWGRRPGDVIRLVATVSGAEHVDNARASGRGALLFLPHLGNWELFNAVMSRRGGFVALYRPARVAEIDRLILTARERSGCTMAPATSGGVRQLLAALRDGQLVLVLPDQEPIRDHGTFAPLFGLPALTMTLACRLLQRTEATALFGTAQRRPDGRFDIQIRPAPADLADPDLTTAVAAMNLQVERAIRGLPEQYQWSYKRFRTRPEGELTPYRSRTFRSENIARLDPTIRARIEYAGLRPTRG